MVFVILKVLVWILHLKISENAGFQLELLLKKGNIKEKFDTREETTCDQTPKLQLQD